MCNVYTQLQIVFTTRNTNMFKEFEHNGITMFILEDIMS